MASRPTCGSRETDQLEGLPRLDHDRNRRRWRWVVSSQVSKLGLLREEQRTWSQRVYRKYADFPCLDDYKMWSQLEQIGPWTGEAY